MRYCFFGYIPLSGILAMCMQNVPCSSWLLDTACCFNLFDLPSSDQAISAPRLVSLLAAHSDIILV